MSRIWFGSQILIKRSRFTVFLRLASPKNWETHGVEFGDGGILYAVTHLLNPDAVRQAVADSVPASFIDLNLKAFEKGFEYGASALTTTASPSDAVLQAQYSRE